MLHKDLVSRDEQLAIFAAKGTTIRAMLLHQAIQGSCTTGPFHTLYDASTNTMSKNVIEEEHVGNQVNFQEHSRDFSCVLFNSDRILT
jgi:hypothetical protein